MSSTWGALKDRDVATYLVGLTLSLAGDTVWLLVAGVWTKQLTSSDGAAGLVNFCIWAPSFVSPLFALLADRVPRRALLIATNAGTAVAMLPLLFVRGPGQTWIVFVVMALYGVSYAIIGAAEPAMVASLVPEDQLGGFNSIRLTISEGFKLVGPSLGAVLFLAFGGRTVAVLDAATFLMAVGALVSMKHREVLPVRTERQRWSWEVRAGFQHIAAAPVARRLVVASAGTFLFTGLLTSFMFAVVDKGLHRSPSFVAALVTAQGVGSVVSGLCGATLMRRWGETCFVGAGTALAAVGCLLAAGPAWTVPVLAGWVLRGLGMPWLLIGVTTLVQRTSDNAIRARAVSAASTAVFIPSTLAIPLGALLVAYVNYRVMYGVAAVGMAMAALYVLAPRRAAEPGDESEELGIAGT